MNIEQRAVAEQSMINNYFTRRRGGLKRKGAMTNYFARNDATQLNFETTQRNSP